MAKSNPLVTKIKEIRPFKRKNALIPASRSVTRVVKNLPVPVTEFASILRYAMNKISDDAAAENATEKLAVTSIEPIPAAVSEDPITARTMSNYPGGDNLGKIIKDNVIAERVTRQRYADLVHLLEDEDENNHHLVEVVC